MFRFMRQVLFKYGIQIWNLSNFLIITNINLGCLHPVACVRSGDGDFYIRLRNVTIVG
jgi:hypothetical protein